MATNPPTGNEQIAGRRGTLWHTCLRKGNRERLIITGGFRLLRELLIYGQGGVGSGWAAAHTACVRRSAESN